MSSRSRISVPPNRIPDPDPGQIPTVRMLISSMDLVCEMATGMPRGWPTREAIRSIREGRDWGVENVTRRPMPASSNPDGGFGFGWMVVRVWGIGAGSGEGLVDGCCWG